MKSLFNPTIRRTLIARVHALRPDAVRAWGRMSPHEGLCHLSDAFRVAIGEKTAAPSDRPLGAFMRFVALNAPLRWPRDVPTMPEVAQGVGGTAPVEFEHDRTVLLALIDRFCERPRHAAWPAHPMFGPMRAGDWGRWGYRHLDHHLRQFGV